MTKTARESIGVDVLTPTLNFKITLHILVSAVEFINHTLDKLLDCIPNFYAVITIIVARQLVWVVNSTLLGVPDNVHWIL